MKKGLYLAFALGTMVAFAGGASAQPLQLTNMQLDHVTGGATSITLFAGGAIGNLGALTNVTATNAVAGVNAAAAADVTSIATSTIPGPGAQAASFLNVIVTSP